MMKHFVKENYLNHSGALMSINKNYDIVNGILTRAGIDFSGKIAGKFIDEELINLRHSLSLRLQSIFYHYDLIANINISGQEYLTNKGINLLYRDDVSLRQDFLFDSIIFQTVSFFDYLGRYISYIVLESKIKLWTPMVKIARAKDKFRESELAKTIDLLDREFVTKLYEYRCKLIHREDDYLPNSQSYNVAKSTVVVSVLAPVGFRKAFKQEFKNHNDNQLDINTISLWLIDCSTESTIEILKKLLDYIEQNRKIQPGKEVIFFQPNSK